MEKKFMKNCLPMNLFQHLNEFSLLSELEIVFSYCEYHGKRVHSAQWNVAKSYLYNLDSTRMPNGSKQPPKKK